MRFPHPVFYRLTDEVLMDINKSKVYVMADGQGRITRIEGGYTTPADLTGWVQIDEGTGDRYNLCQSHYFEGGIYTTDGIPRYKLQDGKALERTEEEIAADRAALPAPPPTAEEQLRADVDYIAIMTGVSL